MISDNLTKQGYHIFPDIYTLSQVTYILNDLNQMNARRTLLDENNQSVWWDEIHIPQSTHLATMILDNSVKRPIEAEFPLIQEAVFWANRYSVGEYIPKHCDTNGDLQIVMPVSLPPKNCGGAMLIHHQRGENLVPQQPGQRLLFRAIRSPHETTKLINSSECANPMRIVCVGRIFFNKLQFSSYPSMMVHPPTA
jgi:hypothetical protein